MRTTVSLTILGLLLLASTGAAALDFHPPIKFDGATGTQALAYDLHKQVELKAGIANYSGTPRWTVTLGSQTITPTQDPNNPDAWMISFQAERDFDDQVLSISVTDEAGEQAGVSYEIKVRPFNIRLYTGPSSNVDAQRAYDKINLMAFLMGDADFNTIFGTPLLTLLNGTSQMPSLRAKLDAARNEGLITEKALLEARTATDNAAYYLGRARIRDKTVRDFFENDYQTMYPNDDDVGKTYLHLKNLARAGIDLPFATHSIYRADLSDKDIPPTGRDGHASISAFLTSYLGVFGAWTEEELYTQAAPDADAKALIMEGNVRRVLLTGMPNGFGGYVTTDEGGETKFNNKVCAQIFDGSQYIDTCVECDPPVQAFCALTAAGDCSTTSNPGPCSGYPPLL